MVLADRVKELRQKLGWNQATLAKEAKITQATISRIESGKVTQPKMGQLQKLADALGTTIDYLATGYSLQRRENMRIEKAIEILTDEVREMRRRLSEF